MVTIINEINAIFNNALKASSKVLPKMYKGQYKYLQQTITIDILIIFNETE